MGEVRLASCIQSLVAMYAQSGSGLRIDEGCFCFIVGNRELMIPCGDLSALSMLAKYLRGQRTGRGVIPWPLSLNKYLV